MESQQSDTGSAWARTDEPLFRLMGIGRESRSGPKYYFDCSQRSEPDNVCLQLTLSGCGYYRRDGVRTLLGEGMAFFDRIPGAFEYGWAVESKGPYELVYVTMEAAEALGWWEQVRDRFGQILHFGTDSVVAAAMLRMVRLYESQPRLDRYLISARLYELLMLVWSELTRSRVAMSPLVSQTLAMLERDVENTSLGVAGIAERIGCTREHLSREFHQAMGVTASQYLMQLRLRRAGRLLRESNEKLENIARQSGFGSATYLCRVFRQQVGVTCADFRRKAWIALP